MRKTNLIAALLMLTFLISGCALSDYLSGNLTEESEYTLIPEEDEEVEELEEMIEEIEEETEAAEEEAEEEQEEETIIEEEIDEENFIKISVQENELVKLKPTAKDADDDTIAYTFSEPLDENGEWQTNYGDAGNYLITVTASDGDLTTEKKVLLTVDRVNVAPEIEELEDTLEVKEGDTVTFSPKVTDPNGDQITITISDPVGESGVWEIGYQTAGDYEVVITASDGELESTEKVMVTVLRKNVAPEIEELGDITIEEGESVEITPEVTDKNGDDVTVTISEPIGDDGIWETAFTDNGEYEVTVTASDGSLESTATFTVTVKDINKAPEILDIVQE